MIAESNDVFAERRHSRASVTSFPYHTSEVNNSLIMQSFNVQDEDEVFEESNEHSPTSYGDATMEFSASDDVNDDLNYAMQPEIDVHRDNREAGDGFASRPSTQASVTCSVSDDDEDDLKNRRRRSFVEARSKSVPIIKFRQP